MSHSLDTRMRRVVGEEPSAGMPFGAPLAPVYAVNAFFDSPARALDSVAPSLPPVMALPSCSEPV